MIELIGFDEIRRALGRMAAATQDQSAALAKIAPILHGQAVRRLTSGSQPAFWPALKHPHSGPALVASGDGARATIEKIGKTSLTQRNTKRYMWYQQVGSKGIARITRTQARSLMAMSGPLRKGQKRLYWTGSEWAQISKRGQVRFIGPLAPGQNRTTKRREQAGRGGLLPRPFLFVDDATMQQCTQILLQHSFQPFEDVK